MTKKITQRDLKFSPNWIEKFIELTSETSSPEIFRKWAAISCLAGVLERRVWIKSMGTPLYPNMYIILVARPGIGKTEVTDRVRLIWQKIKGIHVASTNLSRASFADELNNAVVVSGKHTYNALNASVNELGTLMPKYSPDFMSQLTDIYNCKSYTERKRGGNLYINIEQPFFNMLAGTQPGFLLTLIPEVAWEQGFMGRCQLIFSGEKILRSLFDVSPIDLGELCRNLAPVKRLRGEFGWTDKARQHVDDWHKAGGPPRPTHPKLTNYCERRTEFLLKLIQVTTINHTGGTVVDMESVRIALDWLMEAEEEMNNIFKAMTGGGDSNIINDTLHWMTQVYIRGGQKPIMRAKIIAFLTERTDAYKVKHVLDMMEQSGIITIKVVEGKTGFVPTKTEI